MNDERNQNLYAQYELLSKQESKVIFGGCLGCPDMHDTIIAALDVVKMENMK